MPLRDDEDQGAPPDPSREYRPARDYDTDDSSMRNLALGAVAIAVIVMGGVWVLSSRHHAEIPVIEPDPRPLRVKPADPGGMQVPGADQQVMDAQSGQETDQLAPPPEAPAPQALQQQTQQQPTAPAPLSGPPPTLQPAPAPTPVPQAPPPKTDLAPAPKPATPAPPPAPPGAVEVQLGSLDSEALANQEWDRLRHRAPDLLAARTPRITRFDRDGKTYYRLRTTGFPDIAAATQFCTALKAKGAACALASF